MGIRLPGAVLANAKKVLYQSLTKMSSFGDVPRGFFAVYVGESQKKRFVVPVSYLQQPLFQELLDKAEEEFGFHHPMGGLTIPCREDTFLQVTSLLNRL